MNCPVCNAILFPGSYGGQTIDVCRQCNGVWFDSRELGSVVTALIDEGKIPNQHVSDDLRDTSPALPGNERKKLCPRCNIQTKVFNYSYDSNVFLNTCPACNGVWADQGELNRLARYSKGNPEIRALARELAKSHGHKDSLFRRLLTSRWLSGFVAGFYLVVAAALGDPAVVLKAIGFLLLPLTCIWFSDAMGSYTGTFFLGRPAVTRESPGIMVALAGWIVLLSPLILAIVLAFQ